MSTLALLAYAAVLEWGLDVRGCRSTKEEPFACLGLSAVALVVGVPIVWAVMAWGLQGRGAVHALLGATLCLLVGPPLTLALLGSVPGDLPDWLLVLAAPVTGVATALWAAHVPGVRARGGNSVRR